ncbi:hypothetical protein CH306_08520 [Rhodococcus sp. 15-725-2-2b]|nr:hypothetical protein CH277_09275 [Rhodococcus sp. 06-469-3-2]OZD45657.1 hypothetical protein CH264_15370 [Rhodococcus sp. 06-1477-1A]OZE75664.1 hypothetical protein CH306_08520 [Rhodococcus sp. 15-725-2-2b]
MCADDPAEGIYVGQDIRPSLWDSMSAKIGVAGIRRQTTAGPGSWTILPTTMRLTLDSRASIVVKVERIVRLL